MDRQEYLNQISNVDNTNVPAKSPKSGIFASKFFWVGIIGVVGFIIIMVIGLALGNKGGGPKEELYALLRRMTNTSKIANDYRSDLKSSDLRANGASLVSVLSTTKSKLSDYVNTKYKIKEKDLPKKLLTTEDTARDGLSDALFNAKINGLLDSTYATKMAEEISTIASRESQILKSTKDETLTEILSTSYDSLDTLYDKFNDFSET